MVIILAAMNIRIKNFKEYPFRGTFFRIGIDMDKPPLDRVEENIIILETECDIQEASHTEGAFLKASYSVYFPIGESNLSDIKSGILFEGNMNGLKVNGKVAGVFPSQLGGVKVYVQDLDV